MPEPRILHRGSAAAQKTLYPLGKEVRISSAASGLLQDLRNEANKFGAATDAKEIEKQYEIMQMRLRDAAQYIAVMERHWGVVQDDVMKF